MGDLGQIAVQATGTLVGIEDAVLVPPVRALTYLATFEEDNSTSVLFKTLSYGMMVQFTGADILAQLLELSINNVGFNPTVSCVAWVDELGLDLCEYVRVASNSSCKLGSFTASLLEGSISGNLGSTFESASLNILFAQMIGSGADFGRNSEIYGDSAGGPTLLSPDGRRQLRYDAASQTYEETWLAPPDTSRHRRLAASNFGVFARLTWDWFWRLLVPGVGWGVIYKEYRSGTLPTPTNFRRKEAIEAERRFNKKFGANPDFGNSRVSELKQQFILKDE